MIKLLQTKFYQNQQNFTLLVVIQLLPLRGGVALGGALSTTVDGTLDLGGELVPVGQPVNVVLGEREDDNQGAGQGGGTTELLGGDEVDDDTGADGEDVLVVNGLSDLADTVLQDAGTVDGEVGTEERGEEGTRKGGGNEGVTHTGVVGLSDGVADVVDVLEVVGDVGRDVVIGEPWPGNGGNEDVHVPVEVLEDQTRHGAHAQGQDDAQVTEGAEEAEADGRDEVQGLLYAGEDADAEGKGDELLDVLGVGLQRQELNNIVVLKTS